MFDAKKWVGGVVPGADPGHAHGALLNCTAMLVWVHYTTIRWRDFQLEWTAMSLYT